MNKFFLLLLFLFSHSFSAQEKEKHYYYYVSVNDAASLIIKQNRDGTLKIKDSNNKRASKIFAKYKILVFRRAYAFTQKEDLKKVYIVTTNSDLLLGQLQNISPEKYTSIVEYFPDPIAYYPNDYGTTSPLENLGVNYPLTHLDAMNVPEAWSITRGSKKVVIGISDARVDSTYIDLEGRVSNYLKYFNSTRGSSCAHGTTQASIIGAIMDNGYGIPGICSDCDLITNGYARFDYIQELVEAGAKVINASWVLCGFGDYHQNVQARINEYYEEGVLIVASAGNARKCNRYLRDYASSYGYPASFKNVISVSSVYGDCGYYEDCIVDDKQFGIIAHKLKDRHVVRQRMRNQGSFDQLSPLNSHYATQHNLAVDIVAPAETYLAGRAACDREATPYGGVTSTSASMVTGVIGLIWSANYCLGSAEVESILKLSAEDIESLPGNEPFKMKLGAGRVDAYRAVKMAHEMQLENGIVNISGRDFYRFDFKLYSSPYQIDISNQTFRDSTTVDFKARKRIHLKPGTSLKPDENGFIKLSIDPSLPTAACFPKPVIPKPKVERDSVPNPPRYDAPYKIERDASIKGIRILPVEGVIDTDYVVVIETDTEIFKETFDKTKVAEIPLPDIENETITITVRTHLYRTQTKLRINIP